MSDGYIRHHSTGSVKRQKKQEKEEKQKRLAASCSILGFVKIDNETSCTGTATAADIPFPGRSGPPAQTTESNSITTAAGDLANATLAITDDIIGDIGIENDML